jgi:LytS/YehU family sensor histidine kinase
VSLGLSFGVFIKTYFVIVIDYIFPDYFFISYISGNDFYLVFSIFLVSSTLLKLAQDWVYFNRTQNDILRLKNSQVEYQLKALRSQINPHFLFNSLNVIYAMALENKAHVDSAIIELSDILRYVIYDADTPNTPLKDEVKLIDSYIAFQTHRIKTKVYFKKEIENKNFKVYPMLFLPLIENAYKYGASTKADTETIDIHLIQRGNTLSFTIKNQKLNKDLHLDDHYSGVGLSTLRKNLGLVYAHQHSFEIDETEDSFKAELTLAVEK